MRQKEGRAGEMGPERDAPNAKPKLLMKCGVFNRKLRETLDTNLLHAAQRKQWKRAFSLLEAGAKPSKRDEFEYSALTYAAAGGRKGLVESMVENGVKISILDNASRAAYMKACIGGHREIAELLIKEGDFLNEGVEHRNAPKLDAFMREEAMELIASLIEAYEDEE